MTIKHLTDQYFKHTSNLDLCKNIVNTYHASCSNTTGNKSYTAHLDSMTGSVKKERGLWNGLSCRINQCMYLQQCHYKDTREAYTYQFVDGIRNVRYKPDLICPWITYCVSSQIWVPLYTCARKRKWYLIHTLLSGNYGWFRRLHVSICRDIPSET